MFATTKASGSTNSSHNCSLPIPSPPSQRRGRRRCRTRRQRRRHRDHQRSCQRRHLTRRDIRRQRCLKRSRQTPSWKTFFRGRSSEYLFCLKWFSAETSLHHNHYEVRNKRMGGKGARAQVVRGMDPMVNGSLALIQVKKKVRDKRVSRHRSSLASVICCRKVCTMLSRWEWQNIELRRWRKLCLLHVLIKIMIKIQ